MPTIGADRVCVGPFQTGIFDFIREAEHRGNAGECSRWSGRQLGLEPGRKHHLPLGLPFVYTVMMKKTISVHKKSRGRPATGQDPLISARVPAEVVTSILAWGKAKGVTRSEAIRRLVELGLKAKGQ